MIDLHRRPTRRAQTLRNNATPPERLLWRHLARRQVDGWKFSRQMPVGPYICDFLCRELRLVVEVDGGQHSESKTDGPRTAYLEREGYWVVRYWNNEVTGNIEGVIDDLKCRIEKRSTLSTPLPLAGGVGGGDTASPTTNGTHGGTNSPPPTPPASGRGEE